MNIKSKEQLVSEYNKLEGRFKGLAVDYPKGEDLLRQLSDDELLVYIAGETLRYGRSWEDAIENAKYHLHNKDRAIKHFSHKVVDLLGA